MIASSSSYRVKIDPTYNFSRNELKVTMVRRAEEGYIPLLIEEGTLVPCSTDPDNVPGTVVPREMAEVLLSALAHCLLASDGDLVAENRDLKNRLERTTNQLDQLIAGIGRLGGA